MSLIALILLASSQILCQTVAVIEPTMQSLVMNLQPNKLSAEIKVQLSAKPTRDQASVSLSVNNDHITLDKCVLIFTPTTWNQVQTVTVTMGSSAKVPFSLTDSMKLSAEITLVTDYDTCLVPSETKLPVQLVFPPGRACSIYGDPHFKSFSGGSFSHQGVGKATYVKTPSLWIQGDQKPCGGASCFSSLAFQYRDTVATVNEQRTLSVNGPLANQFSLSGGNLLKAPENIEVSFVSGFAITINVPGSIGVQLTQDNGLCGSMSAFPAAQLHNGLVTANGGLFDCGPKQTCTPLTPELPEACTKKAVAPRYCESGIIADKSDKGNVTDDTIMFIPPPMSAASPPSDEDVKKDPEMGVLSSGADADADAKPISGSIFSGNGQSGTIAGIRDVSSLPAQIKNHPCYAMLVNLTCPSVDVPTYIESCVFDVDLGMDIVDWTEAMMEMILKQCGRVYQSMATSVHVSYQQEAQKLDQHYGFSAYTPSSTSSAKSSAVVGIQCRNGGVRKSDGIGCTCPNGYGGVDCGIDLIITVPYRSAMKTASQNDAPAHGFWLVSIWVALASGAIFAL